MLSLATGLKLSLAAALKLSLASGLKLACGVALVAGDRLRPGEVESLASSGARALFALQLPCAYVVCICETERKREEMESKGKNRTMENRVMLNKKSNIPLAQYAFSIALLYNPTALFSRNHRL